LGGLGTPSSGSRTYRCRRVGPDVEGQHETGGREVGQGKGGVHRQGPERGIAPAELTLPHAQEPGQEQGQGGHEANGHHRQVEAAPEVAHAHRSADDTQNSNEAAQLLGEAEDEWGNWGKSST